jgi:hypothetical protein
MVSPYIPTRRGLSYADIVCRDCEGLLPTCIQAIISQGQASADLSSTQNGNIICVPDTRNTGVLSGNSSVHRPGLSLAPTQASGWDWPISSRISVTNMPHGITPSFPDATSELAAGDTSTSRTGTQTLSTTQSIETQFNTKTSDQSKEGDGIFGVCWNSTLLDRT